MGGYDTSMCGNCVPAGGEEIPFVSSDATRNWHHFQILPAVVGLDVPLSVRGSNSWGVDWQLEPRLQRSVRARNESLFV